MAAAVPVEANSSPRPRRSFAKWVAFASAASLALAPTASAQSTTSVWDYALWTAENYVAHEASHANPEELLADIKAFLLDPDIGPIGSFWELARYLGITEGSSLAQRDCSSTASGCYFGGAGAGGDIPECNIPFLLDADGNLILPSMPLAGSGPLQPGQTGIWTVPIPGEDGATSASSQSGALLWDFHKWNLANRSVYTDPQGWVGILNIVAYGSTSHNLTVRARSVAYYDSQGTKVPAVSSDGYYSVNGPGTFSTSSRSTALPCPSEGGGGGDFHYYVRRPQGPVAYDRRDSVCITYYPSTAVSPSGYFYGPQTTLPANEIANFPTGTWLDGHGCRLGREVVRKVVDEARKRVCPTCDAVTDDDVPPGTPELETVKDPPPSSPEPTGPQPEPTFTPTPTGTPTPAPTEGASASWWDPGIRPNDGGLSLPDLSADLFAWFPDLTIEVPTSTECPVYTATVWDHEVTLDIHCTLIEQNRALISALMIVFFTLSAGLIVLRA